ncbi:hypothetical protein KO494_15885 [Lacinutrix sp. C3R15]|uniref:hypothetical protein n=1 Tax=Flavobacteriaceae TaxID=49546 RepID=UPI001C092C3B|nr:MULTISPECIES: hypothetical protein [Flavobacteriaceae]MBU2941032.1 hypothetical protein [Lacinutrix sp. C3R15]MDO6624351.1 hypothetical protein [Oceanihabitans sp. 1_MG-2023]
MKNAILILITILTLTSCGGEIDLDWKSKRKLTYEQLPSDLQAVFQKKIYAIKNRDTTDFFVFSLDSGYTLTHYWTGMGKNLLSEGFNHHFVINDKKFEMDANQGDPFVLREGKFYYTTELNLAEYNYKKAEFIEIDLTEDLK